MSAEDQRPAAHALAESWPGKEISFDGPTIKTPVIITGENIFSTRQLLLHVLRSIPLMTPLRITIEET